MTAPRHKKVNLFIIGAPKAGTTSLYYYLNQHPGIQMPQIKEPHYFSKDFPKFTNINELDEYHDLFEWDANAQYYGDASVWYLYSDEAIENISAYNSEAKFIVMLRDPRELLPSLHNQLKLTLMEDIDDFEDAWNAIPDRKEGKRIPETCREPKLLFYDEIVKFGDQIERVLKQVDPSNVQIIQFERFKENPQKTVEETFTFLGVSASVSDIDFSVQNERSQIRSPILNRILFEVSKHLNPLIKRSKKLLRISRFGLLAPIRNKNKKKADRKPISPGLEKTIYDATKSDQEKLTRLLDKQSTKI
jgi:hypothetical protein